MIVDTQEGVLKIAEEIYGSKRVWSDVFTHNDGRDGFSVYIHFPEVQITNSAHHRHTIRDLYVRVSVVPQEGSHWKARIWLSGNRGTYTLKEWLSRYRHSHLQRGTSNDWVSFCVGNASAVSLLIAKLRESLEEDDWTMLFLAIGRYIGWESTEGRPYIGMNEVGYPRTSAQSDLRSALAPIADGLPTQAFSFGEGCHVIKRHPLLVEYLDVHSSIKWLNNYTDEHKKNLLTAAVEGAGTILVKGKNKRIKVIIEKGEKEPTSIGMDVVDEYTESIEHYLELFNKLKGYEQARESHQGAFGPSGIRGATYFSNNQEPAGPDKLST